MTEDPLWSWSAGAIAEAVSAGRLSALEVTEAALARKAAVNGPLNAVVDHFDDAARAEAAARDASRNAGRAPGPLEGVPVTIKVNVDQVGCATTNGLPSLAGLIAREDAPVVANLRAAGAVVIGRTNTPELSFRADTDNPLYGRTHNPWGDHMSPGGSSGGAGAAVMAGIGALAHGNDIGGSLRFPAAANGAVTVKPGLGRIPAYNPSQTAERGMLAQAMSVQGVLARSVADLDRAMEPLVGHDPRDPFHVPLPYRDALPDGPRRVALCRRCEGFDLHPEVSRALELAAEALEAEGYEVEEHDPPALREVALTGYRALMGEVKALMGDDIARVGSETLQGIFAEYFRQFTPFEGTELLQMMAKRSDYARRWALFQTEYPLILSPFLPQPFFTPNRDAEGAEGVAETLGAALWSFSMNFMGLPAGSLPTHLAMLDGKPYPINIQIAGPRWREDLVVRAMAAVEKHCPPLAPTLWARMG